MRCWSSEAAGPLRSSAWLTRIECCRIAQPRVWKVVVNRDLKFICSRVDFLSRMLDRRDWRQEGLLEIWTLFSGTILLWNYKMSVSRALVVLHGDQGGCWLLSYKSSLQSSWLSTFQASTHCRLSLSWVRNSMLSLFLLSLQISSAFAVKYRLVDDFVGKGFLHGFEHEAIDDPTHGRVVYVDEATALKQNLTYASGDSFVIRTDYKTVLDPDGPGRNSVRIRSKKTYTTHVAV